MEGTISPWVDGAIWFIHRLIQWEEMTQLGALVTSSVQKSGGGGVRDRSLPSSLGRKALVEDPWTPYSDPRPSSVLTTVFLPRYIEC